MPTKSKSSNWKITDAKKSAAKKTAPKKSAWKTTDAKKTAPKKSVQKDVEDRVDLLRNIHRQLVQLNREVPCDDGKYRSLKTLKCVKPKACPAGKAFRARTRRCVNAESCKRGSERDPVTFRCRKSYGPDEFDYNKFLSLNRGKNACPSGKFRLTKKAPCEDIGHCEPFSTKRDGKMVQLKRERYIPTGRCRIRPKKCGSGTHFDPYAFSCI